MAGVTVRVVGDEDGFWGPYYATTDSKGKFAIVIGEYGKVPDRVEFKADILGDNVKTADTPKWSFTKDCGASDPLQVLDITWSKQDLDDD